MNQPHRSRDHDSIIELLPWYVNGTLDEREQSIVRRHIDECPGCREDVDALSRVQQAVRTETPSPLVPPPRVDALLDAVDGTGQAERRREAWPLLAAAAAVVFVAVIAAFLLSPRFLEPESPLRFETVISPDATGVIDYVIELQVVPDTDVASRDMLFESLGPDNRAIAISEHTYRITVGLDALSLDDLGRYIQDIESRPEVATVTVVAVQLPVE